VILLAFIIGFGMVALGYAAQDMYPRVPTSLVLALLLLIPGVVCLLMLMREWAQVPNPWSMIAVAVFAGVCNGVATVSLIYVVKLAIAGTAIGLMNMGTVPVTVIAGALFFNKDRLDYRTGIMIFFACLAVAAPTYLPARSAPPVVVKPL
jgi:drug/metabolite transporter (DMT)-like permease